jgi:hypothetical protein
MSKEGGGMFVLTFQSTVQQCHKTKGAKEEGQRAHAFHAAMNCPLV